MTPKKGEAKVFTAAVVIASDGSAWLRSHDGTWRRMEPGHVWWEDSQVKAEVVGRRTPALDAESSEQLEAYLQALRQQRAEGLSP